MFIVNSLNIRQFFIAIRETYPITQKVHIILDEAGYLRPELVMEGAYVMNIELHYLRSYSPNVNPTERLWKVVNEEVRNNVTSPQQRRSAKKYWPSSKKDYRYLLVPCHAVLMTTSRRWKRHLQVNRVYVIVI